ncbi:hypothetical protein D3C80_1304700 [compost metagenome]
MLQPGASGQRRGGVALGLHGEILGQRGQLGFEQGDGGAQLQHQAAVHGVLAGGAEVHVALGLGVHGGDLPAEGLDQRDRRVAGAGDGDGQRFDVIGFGTAGGGDGRHGGGRDQPDRRLGARQRGLEIEHALQATAVAEHRTHRRAGEVGIEQLVAQDGVIL